MILMAAVVSCCCNYILAIQISSSLVILRFISLRDLPLTPQIGHYFRTRYGPELSRVISFLVYG